MTHFTEYSAVGRGDTLDCIHGIVGVKANVAGCVALEVNILGRDLSVFNKRLKNDKQKAEKRSLKDNKKKEKPQTKQKSNILDTLKLVAGILSAVKDKFLRYLRIRVAKLKLIIASDDAAKTAMIYGVAVQGVQYIVSILESFSNFSVVKSGDIHVDCDFTKEKTPLPILSNCFRS